MKTSQTGIDMIKKYEGIRLEAYKPVASEEYYTIGYGHYGPDVTKGMTISKKKADDLLAQDIKKFEKYVNALPHKFNQNQFDALVSFAFNLGPKNLKKLCNGRSVEDIGDKITLYTKAGGKTLNGLVRRRKEEQALYKKSVKEIQNEKPVEVVEEPKEEVKEEKPKVDDSFKVKVSIKNLNIRKGPGTNYERTGEFTGPGVFTIVEKKDGPGSSVGWGKLKSGKGWISLYFCEVLK